MADSTRSWVGTASAAESSALEQLSSAQQVRLTEILDRYLRDLENGLPPQPEKLLAANPDLAEVLASYLENLAQLHEVAAAFGRPGESTPAQRADDGDARRLGDFVLVREVGRGGMGVVYEARQLSLDRRVALKVLPFAAVLEAQQIARFKNEAQAAAQLHHPHIVPVFAVGCERGVHYYAMQFIDGQPLDRAIASVRQLAQRPVRASSHSVTARPGETRADRPANSAPAPTETSLLGGQWAARQDYFRTVARLGIQAADALHAAHGYGIVHRDIKPSNLLLDGAGKLWITDFGLARCQSDAALTRSGDIVGTLQYMSPEQALGKAAFVDQRTDVYSLGVTLYELLTLEPAFRAGDAAALRQRIDHQDPARPRQLDPAIPRDLETVVLKAMARERDERYLTAEELAADLLRVLEGKPTVARPPTLADRATRFARRHRRLVAGVAAACVAGMIGLATVAAVVNNERAKAQQNFERAERHFRGARETVDRFGARVAERLADVPGAEQVRRELLDDTLTYYAQFVDEARDDPALRADLALTYSKIGAVTGEMGASDAELNAHLRALELSQQLADADPGSAEYRRRLAVCHNNLGLALRGAGQAREARAEFDTAIRLQQTLVEEFNDVRYRTDLALSRNNLGMLAAEAGDAAAARTSYDAAIGLLAAAAKTNPKDAEIASDLAASYSNLAAVLAETESARAIELHQKAVDQLALIAEHHPAEPNAKSRWALAVNNLGAAQARAGELSQAVASYRRAIALEKQLVRLAPLARASRRDLAVSYNNLGLALARLHQSDNAVTAFRNALGFQEQLMAENPADVETLSSLAGVCNNLGIVLEESGRVEDAAASYQQAVDRQNAAHTQAATVDRYREHLSKHYYNLGRALRKLGRADEAAQAALVRKQLWQHDPQRLLSIAEELALASKQLAENARGELSADRCADLSMAALAEAVAAGLQIPPDLERKESFAALRGRADFAALVHP